MSQSVTGDQHSNPEREGHCNTMLCMPTSPENESKKKTPSMHHPKTRMVNSDDTQELEDPLVCECFRFPVKYGSSGERVVL